jgi:hypothetical protein
MFSYLLQGCKCKGSLQQRHEGLCCSVLSASMRRSLHTARSTSSLLDEVKQLRTSSACCQVPELQATLSLSSTYACVHNVVTTPYVHCSRSLQNAGARAFLFVGKNCLYCHRFECALLRSSKQLQQRRSSAAGSLSMQEDGGSKLSTTLLSVVAVVLFVVGSGVSLLRSSGPLELTSGSQDTVMTSTQERECCCYYFQ